MKAVIDIRKRAKELNLERLKKRRDDMIAEGKSTVGLDSAINKMKQSIKTHKPTIHKRVKRGGRG